MPYRALSCERIGHAMIVRFMSPETVPGWRNRITGDLEDLCGELNWDDETRVILLMYRGMDLAFKSAGEEEEGSFDGPALVEAVSSLKQPVISAVDGDASGLALELALACDIRIGTEGARFGLPQVAEGIIPSAGGTQRLPRLIGPGRAMAMILTGETIDAEEARRIGLLHRVVPGAELADTAITLVKEMAPRSPLAMASVKESLYSGMDLTLDQGMRMELDLYLLLFSTHDRIEGITAFQEKRKPDFKGE